MPNVNLFIERYFPDAYFQGGEYHCRCPAHNDLKESLHITQGDESDGNGSTKILMNCKAGCKTADILKALGASWSEINGQNKRDQMLKKITKHYKDDARLSGAEATDIYDYMDPNGEYLYSRVRFRLPDGSKDMRYMQINYRLGSIKAFSRGSDPVLYHLPELLDSISKGFPVYIVEGEKDVHTLQDQLHYVATTAGSASDWKSYYSRWFRGASVVILPDNDKAGREAVSKIQRDLLEYAYQVKVVYTSQRDKGDVTDYLTEDGGTPEELKQLITDQQWIPAKWITVEGKKQKINPDLLASCIDQNERYLLVRYPDDDRDRLYIYRHGVYERVNKSDFISEIIRPYIPIGKGSPNTLENIFKLLLTAGSHTAKFSDLDKGVMEHYINLRNGLFNIDTQELKPHDPDLLSTVQLDVEYKPGAFRKRNFDKYMRDLVTDQDGNPDEERAKVLQEYFGMILSNIPMYKLKKALFLISFIGDTGKSSLLRLIDSMLGDDKTVAIDLKELDTGSGNRFTLGKMRGRRLIECGDQSSVTITDSSTFKRLTGGDLQRIEEKGKQGDYFRFTGGIVIASNQIPFFSDDHGKHMINRIQMVPLQHSVPEKDTGLEDRMLHEKSAIFNWFMEGLKRVRENNYKLTDCGAVSQFMEEYREGSDSLYRFLMENYEITYDQKDLVSKTEFDHEYHAWCSRINADLRYSDHVSEVRRKNIRQRMISYGVGFTKNGTEKNIYCYTGIKEKE